MRRLRSWVPLILAVLINAGCNTGNKEIIGIKIYEYKGDFKSLSHRWQEMGINTAFTSRQLASDTEFRKVLKKNDIDVFVIFPVFYDTVMLRHDSMLYAITNTGRKAKDSWVEFVCPSRKAYREQKVFEASEIVRQLQPEGLSIDFIRQFVFWEMIYPERSARSIESACFCDSCISDFCRSENIELPDSILEPERRAGFILENFTVKWNEYRTDLIAGMVKEIAEEVKRIQPGIKINVHAVPWRDEDFNGANINVAAQDLLKIAPYTDFISPMCYSQMVRRDDRWIASVVAEMDKKAPGKILPSIQVYRYYVDDPFSPGDFGRCVDAALERNSRGVVFFSWPLFEKDPLRIEIIKEKHKKDVL